MKTSREFIFNGKCASDFGFMVVEPEEEASLGVSRDIIATELSQVRNTKDIYGVKYQDTLPLKFFIIKNKCINDKQGQMIINPRELAELQAWLTSPKTPRKLILVNDQITKEYLGVFTEIAPFEVGSKLYGITATFICNAPYGYTTYNSTVECSGIKIYGLNNISDEREEYTYPVITLLPKSPGTFSIENKTEQKIMTITTKEHFNEIVIDCNKNKITGDGKCLSFADVGWDKSELADWNGIGTGTFKLYWLRFLPGFNELEFRGNGTFKISYKNPVKTGGY